MAARMQKTARDVRRYPSNRLISCVCTGGLPLPEGVSVVPDPVRRRSVGYPVKGAFVTRTPLWRLAAASALVFSLFLSACASSAPNFRGRWKPVNQLPETPVAIPLYEAYVYSVGPMDKTLKQLLTRWAQGSKSSLSYLHPNDYTLYAAVGDINTTNLQQAIGQLNSAYAAYDLVIIAGGGQITVRSGGQPSAGTAEASSSSSGIH